MAHNWVFAIVLGFLQISLAFAIDLEPLKPDSCPDKDPDSNTCYYLHTYTTTCINVTIDNCYVTDTSSSAEKGDMSLVSRHFHFRHHRPHERPNKCYEISSDKCTINTCIKKCCDGWIMGDTHRCEVAICSEDCYNGGYCVLTSDGNKCSCPPPTTGTHCQEVNCPVCENGGECVVDGSQAVCVCQPGYYGKTCSYASDNNELCPSPNTIVCTGQDLLCEDTCMDSKSCPYGEVCCNDGCCNKCMAPVYSKNKHIKKIDIECLNEYDFVLSKETSPYIQLPEASRLVLQIIQNGLAVSWTQASDPENELAFFLLKIVQDGYDETHFRVTEYFLIDVTKTKRIKPQSYQFNWTHVYKHTYEMSATVYALKKPLKTKAGIRKFTINENSSKTESSSIKWENKTTDPCLCKSDVFIRSRSDHKTIHGVIETSAAFPGMTINVQLIDENSVAIQHRQYNIAKNKTVRVTYPNVPHGVYILRVERICPAKCGSVPAVRSHEIYIQRPPAKDAVIEKTLVPAKEKTNSVLIIGFIAMTLISVCTLFGVCACLAAATRRKAVRIVKYTKYTKYTLEHKQDVYHLTNDLERKGVNGHLIDENTN